ncbi:MAG TPA: phosphatase PAP2 family protein [Polyangiaceae bacterium]|jgi:membrane-associated phospholipid phosphatase
MTYRKDRTSTLGAFLVAAAILSNGKTARAQPASSSGRQPTPIDAVGADLVEDFTGYNLLFYGGAVAATGVMAFGGADQAIRVGVQEHLSLPVYGDVSNYVGYLLPVIVAPGVYLVGLAVHDPKVVGAGSAAVQALVVAILTTAVLKVGVGRVYPLNGGDPSAPDRLDHPSYAHDFRPFQSLSLPTGPAWPSGHTVGTTAVAAALTGYYPDELWIPFVGYPVALAIGFGLVDGDRHWASDVLAGALIGHAIGYTTGRAFRRRLTGQGSGADGPRLVPLASPGMTGLAVQGDW